MEGEATQECRRSGATLSPIVALFRRGRDLIGLIRPTCECFLQCCGSFPQSAFGHLGIPGRHGARGVAQAPLCEIEIVSGFVKVRGEAVPQGVKRNHLFSIAYSFVEFQFIYDPGKGF